ncbi:MAG: N-acylglucosamine 2-epimerase [Gemmatimonadetes bacterium]|nr:N-acylglucosamine 2-epimerase [Gemmatimonadota bacterium]
MPNRLARETSPYLLQHAHNPVDWYPWGAEALERARAEDRAILLSIGYAACHWCHVMERESFEDAATAALMNEHFVCIKVDREERPDLDGIYMQAVQAMTGHGGWPMTVFLTPALAPFWGGTYFPPDDRHGMPSFRRVLLSVSDAWRTRREEVQRNASSLSEIYSATLVPARSGGALSPALLEAAAGSLERQYDPQHGGFGGAPKFPQAMSLDFLLRQWARTGDVHALEMVTSSFRHMARGGIYDQVGGGFARYAVDATWLVPHFEKMLYDNALLARLGVHLWQATKDAEVKRVTEETFAWLAREMTSPQGGFYSSLDADSEGHEGKFYVWGKQELDALLGADAETLERYWGVSAEGNFEGQNILFVAGDPSEVDAATLARCRQVLYDARALRVWPGRDEKILASWNGLMLRALAEGARAFDSEPLRAAAIASGEFLFRELVRDGRVLRTHKAGESRLAGYLEDHAAVALGALALWELTFDRAWLDRSVQLAHACIEWFWDDEVGVFFDTARDHEELLVRPRDITDNATPSGTSLAVDLLVRLSDLRHDTDFQRRATWVLETLGDAPAKYAQAFGHALGAADMLVRGATELAVIGDPASDEFRALVRAAACEYAPSLVIAGGPAGMHADIALLADRPLPSGHAATAYLCRGYTCEAPATTPELLREQLRALTRS